MLRYFYKLVIFGLVLYLAIVAGLKAYVETYAQEPVGPPVSVIVVLSAGPVNSERDNRTAVRTAVGAKLYHDLVAAGEDPVLILAGGKEPSERRAKALGMAEMARDAGIPDTAILTEDRSRSTLQNALFSRNLVEGGFNGRTVIITDRFHLPRSWASFRWAGATDIRILAADGPHEDVDWDNLFREALKWPVNAIRALAFSILVFSGWPADALVILTS